MVNSQKRRTSKKEALRWLRTAEVRHDWDRDEWLRRYEKLGIQTDTWDPSETFKLADHDAGVGILTGKEEGGLVALSFRPPNAAENVWEFFGNNFDEVRSRYTFVRAPHQQIFMYVRTSWNEEQSPANHNPFVRREHLFGDRLDILGDVEVLAPPSVVDHRHCGLWTPNCPHKGKEGFGLMNNLRVGEMPDMMYTLDTCAVGAGWVWSEGLSPPRYEE